MNLRAGTLCGFSGVKTKFFRLSFPLKQLFSGRYLPFDTRDSHSIGVKPSKTFQSVFRITVRVFV
jgi:hypothetical protein